MAGRCADLACNRIIQSEMSEFKWGGKGARLIAVLPVIESNMSVRFVAFVSPRRPFVTQRTNIITWALLYGNPGGHVYSFVLSGTEIRK